MPRVFRGLRTPEKRRHCPQVVQPGSLLAMKDLIIIVPAVILCLASAAPHAFASGASLEPEPVELSTWSVPTIK